MVDRGVVTSVTGEPGAGAMSRGTVVLVGREAGADLLRDQLEVGERVSLHYDLVPAARRPRRHRPRPSHVGGLAELMRCLGADDAINLDGGGSSTLVARQLGDDRVTVENVPTDGAERPVRNVVGVFVRG